MTQPIRLSVEEVETYRAFMKESLKKFNRAEILDRINNPIAYINDCKCCQRMPGNQLWYKDSE